MFDSFCPILSPESMSILLFRSKTELKFCLNFLAPQTALKLSRDQEFEGGAFAHFGANFDLAT